MAALGSAGGRERRHRRATAAPARLSLRCCWSGRTDGRGGKRRYDQLVLEVESQAGGAPDGEVAGDGPVDDPAAEQRSQRAAEPVAEPAALDGVVEVRPADDGEGRAGGEPGVWPVDRPSVVRGSGAGGFNRACVRQGRVLWGLAAIDDPVELGPVDEGPSGSTPPTIADRQSQRPRPGRSEGRRGSPCG
jgi:hypothetical protein